MVVRVGVRLAHFHHVTGSPQQIRKWQVCVGLPQGLCPLSLRGPLLPSERVCCHRPAGVAIETPWLSGFSGLGAAPGVRDTCLFVHCQRLVQ